MGKKLLSRAEFARRAGISAAAVTQACQTILKAASDGKRINVSHPVAVKYLEDKGVKQTEPLAPGLDPLYQVIVDFCESSGRYTSTGIQSTFKIGRKRADAVLGIMRAGGLGPDKNKPAPPPPPKPPKKPHIRGQQAAKETKKAAEQTDRDDIIEIPANIQAFAHMTLTDLIDKFGTDMRFVDWLNATQKIESINEKRLKNAQTRGELVNRDLIRVGIIEPFDAAHIKLLTDGAKTIARRSDAMSKAGRSVDDIEKFVAEQMTSFIRPVKAKISRALKNV